MKKKSLAALCILITLTIGLCLNVVARQGGQAAKAQARASLDASLDQLERGLKEGASINIGYRYVRRTYVRLKRSGGCAVSFRVTRSPGYVLGRSTSEPAEELTSEEWRVNLSELDPAKVELFGPNDGNFTTVQFSALSGKEAIRLKGNVYNSGTVAVGRFQINEKVAPQVAEALRQAITACKQ
jgi:hypothetical protein